MDQEDPVEELNASTNIKTALTGRLCIVYLTSMSKRTAKNLARRVNYICNYRKLEREYISFTVVITRVFSRIHANK